MALISGAGLAEAPLMDAMFRMLLHNVQQSAGPVCYQMDKAKVQVRRNFLQESGSSSFFAAPGLKPLEVLCFAGRHLNESVVKPWQLLRSPYFITILQLVLSCLQL